MAICERMDVRMDVTVSMNEWPFFFFFFFFFFFLLGS